MLYTESGVTEMPSGQLITDMEAAKDSLWRKNGSTSFSFHLWNIFVVQRQ